MGKGSVKRLVLRQLMGGQQRTPEVKKVEQGWMYRVYRNPSVYVQEHVGAYLQTKNKLF